MLQSLFKYPAVLARHRNAPLSEERDHYLRHRAQQGCAHGTLLRIARELLPIVHRLDIPSKSLVTAQQINTAAERWARQQCRRGRAHSFRWSRELFVQVATDWLQFLGRLDKTPAKPLPFAGVIEEFCQWMSAERGLSSVTVRNYSWHLEQFLKWCKDHDH